jgi:putative addiction module component (TIGR02574 family)
MPNILDDILKLSVPERIKMVQTIWDSIAKEMDGIEVTEETILLLDERIEYHRLNPTEGTTWQEVRDRISKKMKP